MPVGVYTIDVSRIEIYRKRVTQISGAVTQPAVSGGVKPYVVSGCSSKCVNKSLLSDMVRVLANELSKKV